LYDICKSGRKLSTLVGYYNSSSIAMPIRDNLYRLVDMDYASQVYFPHFPQGLEIEVIPRLT